MRSRRAHALGRVVSVSWMICCACSLDQRKLSGSPDDAGAPSYAESGAGAGTPDPPPSGSGSGGTSPGLVDGCADLDTDGVADCTTTLVQNPRFAEDVSGWAATAGAELSWDPKNALEDGPSGSAKLSATGLRGVAAQCVSVTGRLLVIAYAHAFVEGTNERGRAELEASFFETEDCSGERAAYFETPPSSVTGTWAVVQAASVAPERTRSISLGLVGLGADADAELRVYFDNVMLKTKAL